MERIDRVDFQLESFLQSLPQVLVRVSGTEHDNSLNGMSAQLIAHGQDRAANLSRQVIHPFGPVRILGGRWLNRAHEDRGLFAQHGQFNSAAEIVRHQLDFCLRHATDDGNKGGRCTGTQHEAPQLEIRGINDSLKFRHARGRNRRGQNGGLFLIASIVDGIEIDRPVFGEFGKFAERLKAHHVRQFFRRHRRQLQRTQFDVCTADRRKAVGMSATNLRHDAAQSFDQGFLAGDTLPLGIPQRNRPEGLQGQLLALLLGYRQTQFLIIPVQGNQSWHSGILRNG